MKGGHLVEHVETRASIKNEGGGYILIWNEGGGVYIDLKRGESPGCGIWRIYPHHRLSIVSITIPRISSPVGVVPSGC